MTTASSLISVDYNKVWYKYVIIDNCYRWHKTEQ